MFSIIFSTVSGYHGVQCSDRCPAGKFGFHCTHACTCDKLGTDMCDHVTGECRCKPGFYGELELRPNPTTV